MSNYFGFQVTKLLIEDVKRIFGYAVSVVKTTAPLNSRNLFTGALFFLCMFQLLLSTKQSEISFPGFMHILSISFSVLVTSMESCT